ncbi:unnamed protein product [Linum tenue]|uniref:Uncharacterized protein n=1 Tax=Linum tenue TaxID=586396 RepID=A0AAV0MCH1_9ROSI|nr:unnamed protein product [Linum tenue]
MLRQTRSTGSRSQISSLTKCPLSRRRKRRRTRRRSLQSWLSKAPNQGNQPSSPGCATYSYN